MAGKKGQNKPSITALSVASAFQRMLATKYGYLFSTNELNLMTHLINEGINPIPLLSMNGLLARTLSILPYETQTGFLNLTVGQYYDEYIMLRKFMVRERIKSAINQGARQVVFLSGGYDIRSFICAQEHLDVLFYELDRGMTRETKLEGMNTVPYEKLGFKSIQINKISNEATQINSNLFYLECDFSTDDLSATLKNYGFKKELKSLIIGEGLTMYLDEQENKNLFKCSHNLMGNSDSELLLGYCISLSNESKLAKLVKKTSNERRKFYLPPKNAITFAASSELDIIAKQEIADMFTSLEEDRVEFFKDPKSRIGRECYYLMKKQTAPGNKTKTIESVPEMNISIPVKARSTRSGDA